MGIAKLVARTVTINVTLPLQRTHSQYAYYYDDHFLKFLIISNSQHIQAAFIVSITCDNAARFIPQDFPDILLCWTRFGRLLSSTKHLLKPPVSHIMQCFEINLWPASILQTICLHPKHLEVQKSTSDVRSEHRRAAFLMLVPGVSIDMMPNSIMVHFCSIFQALQHCAFAKSRLRLWGSGENCAAHYAPLGFLAESVWRKLWGT